METSIVILASPLFLGAFALGTSALGLLLAFVSRNRRIRPVNRGVPKVTLNGKVDSGKAILQAYQKYADRTFLLDFGFEKAVIIPPKFLSEISQLPAAQASAAQEHFRKFQGKYTGVGTKVSFEYMASMAKRHILRRSAQSIVPMRDEVELAVATIFGCPEEWSPFPMFRTANTLVAQVISRVFVGIPTCRNPEWQNLIIGLPTTLVAGAVAALKYPRWLRPLVAPLLKEMRHLKSTRQRMQTLITPGLRERSSKLVNEPDSEVPSDLISWTIKESEGEAWDPEIQTHYQAHINVPAIGTTSQLLTNVIYDLCAHPAYSESLRAEWQSVVVSAHGEISEKSLLQLHKMDSFMRESQRLSPFTLLTIARYLPSKLVLPSGEVVPRGSTIAAAQYAMNRDPDIFANPDEFDGERFLKLREKKGIDDGVSGLKDSSRWGLLDLHAQANVNFGLGKHACPGRVLAVNAVKLLLGQILMEYDFRFDDQAKGKPPSKLIGNMLLPNTTARVMFRKRSGKNETCSEIEKDSKL